MPIDIHAEGPGAARRGAWGRPPRGLGGEGAGTRRATWHLRRRGARGGEEGADQMLSRMHWKIVKRKPK